MIVSCRAPAKINLGLEIIGKRPDGFHEIRTILQMIELYDLVEVSFADRMQIECIGIDIDPGTNLALRAAELWRDHRDPLCRNLSIKLTKQIPAAAGLGGASSDAAAVLLLVEELSRRTDDEGNGLLDVDERLALLGPIAAQLGSDVPFFLGTSCAIARGRGEILESVEPVQDKRVVIVTPAITIERKTATMYGSLDPSQDFSDGRIVERSAELLNGAAMLDPRHLRNAFARPLRALYPEVDQIAEIMGFFADGLIGLSGAGPSWFALVDSDESARQMSAAITKDVPSARIVTTRPLVGHTVVTASWTA